MIAFIDRHDRLLISCNRKEVLAVSTTQDQATHNQPQEGFLLWTQKEVVACALFLGCTVNIPNRDSHEQLKAPVKNDFDRKFQKPFKRFAKPFGKFHKLFKRFGKLFEKIHEPFERFGELFEKFHEPLEWLGCPFRILNKPFSRSIKRLMVNGS